MVLETYVKVALLSPGCRRPSTARMKAKRPRTGARDAGVGWPSPSSPYDRRCAAVASAARRPQDREIP
jgi:hypothetical protein